MRICATLLSFTLLYCLSANAQEERPELVLSYIGSSTVGNFIEDANAELDKLIFNMDTRPESAGGELAILEGRADIAGIARLPNKDLLSKGVASTLIGWDAIAIIVHPNNPIKNLTQSQLKAVYTGEIRNWKELGGPDLAISPYIVGLESATRKVCRSIILGSADYKNCTEVSPDVDILDKVANNPGGIGQISFSFIKAANQVKALRINGQDLSLTNSNYPITRPLYLLWWPGRRDVAAFVNWAISSEGQRVVMQRFIGTREATVQIAGETGALVVYTKTIPKEDGGIFYYPHSEYDILAPDRSLIVNVQNHLSNNDEEPTQVELPIGNYLVRTNAKNGEAKEFAVTIESGKITRLFPERAGSLYEQFELNANTSFWGIKNSNSLKNNSKSFNLFGDFRVRAEQDIKGDQARFRGRFRIRAGAHIPVHQRAKFEFRLVSTSDPNDPNSSHVDLDQGFNQIKVAIDRAYFHIRPRKYSFFEWWLGKFAKPDVSSKIFPELVWDADIQPEGTAFSLKAAPKGRIENLNIMNGFYLLSQLRTGNRKNWINNSQISGDIKINRHWRITLASSLSYFSNIKRLEVTSPIIDTNDGNKSYQHTTISGSDTLVTSHYLSNFHILDNFVLVKTSALKRPLTLKVQAIHNLGANGSNKGFASGISYGDLAEQNRWLFYYQFHYLEQDAVFTPFVQDDLLRRSNSIGHVCGMAYSFHKKISLHLWGLFDAPLDSEIKTNSRIRLDLNVKF